ncbi:MAG: nucleotidyltransferase family protein [Pseudomonadota bacterium]
MNIETLRTKYRNSILQIADKYKAENVRVFGSVARGENNDKSDIDLLVHFKEGASLLDESGLDIDLTELLGCKVDVISDRSIRDEFKPFILKEAQEL